MCFRLLETERVAASNLSPRLSHSLDDPIGCPAPLPRMASIPDHVIGDVSADLPAARISRRLSVHKQLLGGRFRFESDHAPLLDLVEAAYCGLPQHQLSKVVPEFCIELRLVERRAVPEGGTPPPVRIQSGADLLCGMMDASNYVVIAPAQRHALVVASEDMLRFAYHLRYELIEFAVFILAARGLGLVPLHGACIGREGRGVLLLGDSGAGKSTLALHALLHGLDFLAEDAVFVQPDSLLATGVANYVHMKPDALQWVDHAPARNWLGAAPVIRRRSGVEKFEADLRFGHGRLAKGPLRLVGAVFVSGAAADDPACLLRAMPRQDIAGRLQADQPYAAAQPGWFPFQQKLVRMGMHELRRGTHPAAAVDALRQLLDSAGA